MAPTASGNGLHSSRPAHPTQVAQIRRAVGDVARRCGADDATLTRLELAVTEAATNVVLHAYRDPAHQGHIHTTARVAGRELEVTIRDDGVGLSPNPDSPGLGLGLSLMAHEADRCEITTPPSGGTEIRMGFVLRRSTRFVAGDSIARADAAGAGATR
jgi:serine/threonine-protein kinase RsbW/stage II sporulation protein AB (anti-sigma F factor)